LAENTLSDSTRVGRPSVCRNCGAIIGAGESTCAQCGAPLVAAIPDAASTSGTRRIAYDREAMRFARAVFSRPAIFTTIFIVANVLIFLLMLQGNAGSIWEPSVEVLRAYGAKFNSLINAGQWWRFVTPMFIHIGVIHLLVNMYGLFMLGPFVEKLYGSAKFVVFWVMTGVAGVAASYFAASHQIHNGILGRFLFRGSDGPSAGASGALFGLIGVLFIFGIKFRHELPEELKRAFGTGMLPTILLNLFIGYAVPFIDNAAHLGGLVAGALLALVIDYKRPHEKPRVELVWHILQAATLALIIISFVMVARHFRDTPPGINQAPATIVLPGETAKFIANFGAFNEGQQAFAMALTNRNAGAAAHALETLDKAPPLDEETDAIRNDLKNLLTRARDFAAAASPTPSSARASRAQQNELVKDFQAWQKKFNLYLRSDGAKYGLQVQSDAPPANDAREKK
jgi:membrane associated rhomboid family serine protease